MLARVQQLVYNQWNHQALNPIPEIIYFTLWCIIFHHFGSTAYPIATVSLSARFGGKTCRLRRLVWRSSKYPIWKRN